MERSGWQVASAPPRQAANSEQHLQVTKNLPTFTFQKSGSLPQPPNPPPPIIHHIRKGSELEANNLPSSVFFLLHLVINSSSLPALLGFRQRAPVAPTRTLFHPHQHKPPPTEMSEVQSRPAARGRGAGRGGRGGGCSTRGGGRAGTRNSATNGDSKHDAESRRSPSTTKARSAN